MLLTLVFLLFKKYVVKRTAAPGKRAFSFPYKITVLLLLPLFVSGEEKMSTYAIKYNGNVVGHLQYYKKVNNEDVFIKMNSIVKTRFVFAIDVRTNDQSRFTNGLLVNSHVYRSVNGKEKENKRTSLINDVYQIHSGAKTKTLSGQITYNMMMMYGKEPLNILQVYSDNFQQFIPIRPIGNHAYRINLPDGNYNDYHFQNGICKLVEIHHSMYTIKMELI